MTNAASNVPATTTSTLPITENTTVTPEGTEGTSTTDAQQSTVTTNNAIKDTTCNQNSATTGVIIGVAISGILTGALLTLLATFIIVAITRLTKKNKGTLTLLAVNQISQGISGEEIKMKDVEEPVYNVILSNPAVSDQLDMNINECYGTLRTR